MGIEVPLDSRGRVLIPEKVREGLGLKPGGRVVLEIEAGAMRLRPKRGRGEDPLFRLMNNPLHVPLKEARKKPNEWKDETWKR